jgi:signal transduction histidine kinase
MCQTIGAPLRSLPIEWNCEEIESHIHRCRTTFQTISLDRVRVKTAGGQDAFLKMTMSCMLADADGAVVMMGEDTTERLRLERELTQAQKLESIGQLAAGIAHEINTPTQFIGDNVRFLQDSFGDVNMLLGKYRTLLDSCRIGPVQPQVLTEIETLMEKADIEYLVEEIPKAIQQSLEGIERVAKIVRAMKEFAHPGTEGKTLVHLNKAIESTVTVARNEWKYVADMVTDFDPTLPDVPLLLGDFNQVVLNLIVNAAHAIADVVRLTPDTKGTITISTHRQGEWAEVRITDTGTGIPESVRGKVFDPFFTTKGVGKGTGQGLAISRSVIVEKHGGSITFDTVIGQGTTFIIRLPLQSRDKEPAGLALEEGYR